MCAQTQLLQLNYVLNHSLVALLMESKIIKKNVGWWVEIVTHHNRFSTLKWVSLQSECLVAVFNSFYSSAIRIIVESCVFCCCSLIMCVNTCWLPPQLYYLFCDFITEYFFFQHPQNKVLFPHIFYFWRKPKEAYGFIYSIYNFFVGLELSGSAGDRQQNEFLSHSSEASNIAKEKSAAEVFFEKEKKKYVWTQQCSMFLVFFHLKTCVAKCSQRSVGFACCVQMKSNFRTIWHK